jgi:hypothetical protein
MHQFPTSLISAIRRPNDTLFIFDTPKSSACSWVIGVESAATALYICRVIVSNPHGHTILTIAYKLLQHGIPFRTLIHLPSVSNVGTLSSKTQPSSYRKEGYKYTTEDFEGAMVKCKRLLTAPQGRAALLQGGIVWRIAREFLSLDAALEGPSIEVTEYCAGFSVASHMRGHQHWDDSLNDLEIGIICGTYVLYTG